MEITPPPGGTRRFFLIAFDAVIAREVPKHPYGPEYTPWPQPKDREIPKNQHSSHYIDFLLDNVRPLDVTP